MSSFFFKVTDSAQERTNLLNFLLSTVADSQGSAGLDGENGKSAYEIAVSLGYVGTEAQWIASLKGTDGVDGIDGKSVTAILSSKVGKTTTVSTYIDGILANQFQILDGADGGGSGDMLKSTYDTTGNGVVDVAESVAWAGITDKPTIGDMLKTTYDTNNSGVVDSAEKLATAITINDVSFDGSQNITIPVPEIDDETQSTTKVYSSSKTQSLHDIQAQSIANLATAQGEITADGSPAVLVLTTTEQNLPFSVSIPSTNENMFTFDDVNNQVDFLSNASFNFKTSLSLLLNTALSRTVTIYGRNVSDNSVVYTRDVTISGVIGDIVHIDSNQLLTVGKNGIPASPLSIYFTLKANGTGVTLRELVSQLASSSTYDLSTEASGISVIPSGGIQSTNVENALHELDDEKLSKSGGTMTGAITAIRETRISIPANNIDLSLGNLFTKTISATTTLTISNVLASGNANSFILELTNAGAFALTWFSGVKWASGTAPTLTASGVDILGFYSHDGGTTWRGFVISKDSK